MLLRLSRRKRTACLIPLAVALLLQPLALAQECGEACNHHHCPPCFPHCTEGPPRIKFKCACPKPVCPPDCDTPNWGYFEPCWRPWPWPPNYAHCPCPVPAACAERCGPGCYVPCTNVTQPPAGEELPPPRKVDPFIRKGI
jgi:hypothetical protein